MRAAVLYGVGEKLRVEQVPDPVAGPGEAVVKIGAAALNRRDVWIRKGQYAGLKFPIILGSDGAGVVESVGDGVHSSWIGREVIIDAALDFGDSPSAQAGKFRILGLPDDGTFAEKVKVPAANLYKKPDWLSIEEAAAVPLAALTAYRAVCTRAGLKPGEKLLVTGAGGGAAVFALQIGVAAGADVYVTSGSEAKIQKATELGAKGGANYRDEKWDADLKALAGGFDVIVDSAGGEGFSKLIELAKPGGRIVFFGATAGDPPGLNMRRVFWKQLSLLGTTMGSPNDFKGMLELFETHKIKPVVDSVFDLERADEALDRMASSGQMGKIVLRV